MLLVWGVEMNTIFLTIKVNNDEENHTEEPPNDDVPIDGNAAQASHQRLLQIFG